MVIQLQKGSVVKTKTGPINLSIPNRKVVDHCFTLFLTIQTFNDPKRKGFGERNSHFSNVKFVICKCFQFGHFQTLVVW